MVFVLVHVTAGLSTERSRFLAVSLRSKLAKNMDERPEREAGDFLPKSMDSHSQRQLDWRGDASRPERWLNPSTKPRLHFTPKTL